MGIFRDIFSVKEKLWEGMDEGVYTKYCKALRDAGLVIQAFKVNQETPKCTGNCASCASCPSTGKDVPFYEKLGSGCSDDLLNHKGNFDLYAIYVKKVELDQAQKIIAM